MLLKLLTPLILGLILAGCAREDASEASPSAPPTPEGPRVELEGVTLSETVEGERAWELRARRVDYRQEVGIAELEQVTARFFEDGAPASAGRAPRAVFHLGDRRLRLLGGIEVAAEDGRAGFTAHEATWLPAEGRLSAAGDVRFWRGPNRLQGAALTADRGLKQVQLSGQVRGRAALDMAGTAAASDPSSPMRTP